MPATFRDLVRLLAIVAISSIAVYALSGCGGNDDEKSNDTDVAFVEAMTPHHAMAVQSAQYQFENGKDEDINATAQEIVNAQMAEISEFNRIAPLIGAKVDPAYAAPLVKQHDMSSHDQLDAQTTAALQTLGLTAEQAGMSGNMHEQLDEEFAVAMIPHHEGAIRMARVQVENGENPVLLKIARNIIASQSREIEELKQLSK